jgi:hypothetical protein
VIVDTRIWIISDGGARIRVVMKKKRNNIAKGFLKTYRTGEKNGVTYLKLHTGFLKLEYGLYDNPELLCLVSFVPDTSEDAIAIGMRLEMNLQDDQNGDEVTYISENGVSGLQWSGGEVIWGHTYDDDSPPEPGRKVTLDEWLDECVDSMINPSEEEINERQ